MTGHSIDARVDRIRAFNRFYTKTIGALGSAHLETRFSLTEVRVLYELATRDGSTASDVAAALSLDPGYLSRILRRFERSRLIARERSTKDGRRAHLVLTARGRAQFGELDRLASDAMKSMLAPMADDEQRRIVSAMDAIGASLGERGADQRRAPRSYVLRAPSPGDLGWIIERHGALYAAEHSWLAPFEALVAGVVAEYAASHDPSREACWIAEMDGHNVGCVMLMAKSRTVAKLRMLLVEPKARGIGIASRLVEECVRFAKSAGYRTLTLWTQRDLVTARRIYERAGFVRVSSEKHELFGPEVVGETWALDLRKAT